MDETEQILIDYLGPQVLGKRSPAHQIPPLVTSALVICSGVNALDPDAWDAEVERNSELASMVAAGDIVQRFVLPTLAEDLCALTRRTTSIEGLAVIEAAEQQRTAPRHAVMTAITHQLKRITE
jgi:hypothetical protein